MTARAPLILPAADLKMMRETLCRAQTYVAEIQGDGHWFDVTRIQTLIDLIDRHRPIGPDGTHGDRHTTTCGCEDATVSESTGHVWPCQRFYVLAMPDDRCTCWIERERPGL